MNKYQEALNRIKVHVPEYKLINNHIVEVDKHSDLCKLQELVDRETPMKPIELINDERSTTHNCCPKCEVEVDFRYCSDCGQRLDWSDEE